MTDATSVPTFAAPPPDYGYAIIFVVSVCSILLFGFVALLVWLNRKWKTERRENAERESAKDAEQKILEAKRDAERDAEKKEYLSRLEKLDARREEELRTRREDDERRRREDKADHEKRYEQEIQRRDEFRQSLRGEIREQFLELAGLTNTSFQEITDQAKANGDAYTKLARLVDGLERRISLLEKLQKQ